ncbi:MAG: hypothetical protein IT201_14085 [Thermoleophilia bacterium]|nr:hypothetical protein [Thermoleophilia bacterium]
MRRLAAIGLTALAAAGCGGAGAGERGSPPPVPAAASEPTPAQLEFRERLLEQLASGEYGDCECTGDERAADRQAAATDANEP